MMDGYTLMAKMRKARMHFRLNPTEQALFTELVEVCNREGWKDVFYCSNEQLRLVLFVSENTIIKARNMLINSGLIFYRSGKSKRSVGVYSFVRDFKTTSKNEVDAEVDGCTNAEVDAEVDGSDSYKTKTETKNNNPLNPPPGGKQAKKNKGDKELLKKELDNLVHPDLLAGYVEYLNMRQEIGKEIKSLTSLRRNYEHLMKLSEGNIDVAKEIIFRSVSNQYQGLHPLKTNQNAGNTRSQKQDEEPVYGRY